jgi:hypothetical protein
MNSPHYTGPETEERPPLPGPLLPGRRGNRIGGVYGSTGRGARFTPGFFLRSSDLRSAGTRVPVSKRVARLLAQAAQLSPSPPMEERVGERRPLGLTALTALAQTNLRMEETVPCQTACERQGVLEVGWAAASCSAKRFGAGWVPNGRHGGFWFHTIWVRGNEEVVLDFAFNSSATRSLVKRIPDFQQHAGSIFSPLPVAESQHEHAARIEELLPNRVVLSLSGKPVTKAVQLHREPSEGTIEIQEVSVKRVLATKLEPSEPTGTQRAPELAGFFTLVTPQPARVPDVPSHEVQHTEVEGGVKRLVDFERLGKDHEAIRFGSCARPLEGGLCRRPPLPGSLLPGRRGNRIGGVYGSTGRGARFTPGFFLRSSDLRSAGTHVPVSKRVARFLAQVAQLYPSPPMEERAGERRPFGLIPSSALAETNLRAERMRRCRTAWPQPGALWP